MNSVSETTALNQRAEIRSAVLTLSGPAIVEMLLQMMVGLFDTAMVGRLGAEALAAVGLGAQVTMIGTTIVSALVTGTTALVARHIGAKEKDEASEVVRQSLILGTGIAFLVAVLTYNFASSILHLLFRGVSEDALMAAASYVRIVAFGIVPVFFIITVNGALRGAGDTKTPMKINALINICNVSLNYVLIFGALGFPPLGIKGAAIATAIAVAIGGGIILFSLFDDRLLISLRLNDDFKPNKFILKRVLTIGVPAAIEQTMMRAGQVIFSMIVSSLGTIAYAAHQVAINAESISFMPGFGFALAATALVGQGLGAEDPDRAEAGGKEAVKMAIMIMSAMGIIFFFFSPWIVRFFTPDEDVIRVAATALKIIGLCQPALAIVMVLAGGLRGAGATRSVMVVTTLGFFVVRIPIAYLLVRFTDLGLAGAWLGMGIDLIIRAIFIGALFLGGEWKQLKV